MINKKKLQNDILALKGMLCLSDHEALALDRWVKRHLDLPPIYSLNQACDAACAALEEGLLAECEGIELLQIFKRDDVIEAKTVLDSTTPLSDTEQIDLAAERILLAK